MLCQCWATVCDGGTTLKQHRVDVSCLLVLAGCPVNIPPFAWLFMEIFRLDRLHNIWDEMNCIFKAILVYIYRVNWARRTSWWWWDEWDDTAPKTQDSKFEPWRSEAEYATSRSRSLTEATHNIESLRVIGEETFCFVWNLKARVGFEPAISGSSSRQLSRQLYFVHIWSFVKKHNQLIILKQWLQTIKYQRPHFTAMLTLPVQGPTSDSESNVDPRAERVSYL